MKPTLQILIIVLVKNCVECGVLKGFVRRKSHSTLPMFCFYMCVKRFHWFGTAKRYACPWWCVLLVKTRDLPQRIDLLWHTTRHVDVLDDVAQQGVSSGFSLLKRATFSPTGLGAAVCLAQLNAVPARGGVSNSMVGKKIYSYFCHSSPA